MEHRIYFDEDSLAEAVIGRLRAAGATCLLTSDVGRLRSPDPEQLGFAAEQHLIPYTANQADFARLPNEWMEAGRHHAGIVIWRQSAMNVGTQIRALTRLLNEVPPEEFADRIEYLTRWIPRE